MGALKILVIDFTLIMKLINAQRFCPRTTFQNKIEKRREVTKRK